MNKLYYELIDGNRKGKLLEGVILSTPIYGYSGFLSSETEPCELKKNGELIIHKGFTWDFGSGAIDTPSMVRASLFHDAMCHLTNHRAVPWEVRRKADKHFRELLKRYAPEPRGNIVEKGLRSMLNFSSRWWRWSAVSIYSQFIARWKDKAPA